MTPFERRALLAAGATLAAGLALRKPWAAEPALAPLAALQAGGAAVPAIRFVAADGVERTLADYAGQGVVLNLWATWCVPCVAEMPALAALAARMKDAGVAVLPLSSDRGGAAAVERFYRDKGVQGLPVLLDPRGEAARALGARGIPTTLLIDSAGRERGRTEGAVDWASDASVEIIRGLAG